MKNSGQKLLRNVIGLWQRWDVPFKVRAKLGENTFIQAVPNDTTPDAITDVLMESVVETNRTDERVKTNKSLGGASAAFTNLTVTRDLQLGTVTETFSDNGAISPDTLTVTGNSEDLGTGKFMKSITKVDSVLPLQRYTIRKEDLLPPIFRIATPTSISELTSTGTASIVALSGGELEHTEEQLNAFHKRTISRTLANVNDGVSFVGKEHISQLGGGIVLNTEATAANGNLAVDVNTVDARSTPLGTGQFLVETKTKETPGWPILTETKWDEFAQIFIKTTKQVVAPGTITTQLATNVATEEQQLDDIHSLKIITQTLTGTPATQTIPVAVNVSIPSVITGQAELTASSGVRVDYGLVYTLTQNSGEFPAILTRTFYTSQGAAAAAAHAPTLSFITESSAYGYTNSVASFNPNFLGEAQVFILRVPDHVTSTHSGDFYSKPQIQPWRLGYWVLEQIKVTLP